jgi:hypothetical protein
VEYVVEVEDIQVVGVGELSRMMRAQELLLYLVSIKCRCEYELKSDGGKGEFG